MIGKNLIVKWRGKPVFIRHRTPDEISEAEAVDVKSLRDPQKDEDRVQRPEWYVFSLSYPSNPLHIFMPGFNSSLSSQSSVSSVCSRHQKILECHEDIHTNITGWSCWGSAHI